jgi:hypothetical protein
MLLHDLPVGQVSLPQLLQSLREAVPAQALEQGLQLRLVPQPSRQAVKHPAGTGQVARCQHQLGVCQALFLARRLLEQGLVLHCQLLPDHLNRRFL